MSFKTTDPRTLGWFKAFEKALRSGVMALTGVTSEAFRFAGHYFDVVPERGGLASLHIDDVTPGDAVTTRDRAFGRTAAQDRSFVTTPLKTPSERAPVTRRRKIEAVA